MAVTVPPPRIGKAPVAMIARKPPTKTRAKRKAKPVVIDKPGLINQ
jgi:hypothetical protein